MHKTLILPQIFAEQLSPFPFPTTTLPSVSQSTKPPLSRFHTNHKRLPKHETTKFLLSHPLVPFLFPTASIPSVHQSTKTLFSCPHTNHKRPPKHKTAIILPSSPPTTFPFPTTTLANVFIISCHVMHPAVRMAGLAVSPDGSCDEKHTTSSGTGRF